MHINNGYNKLPTPLSPYKPTCSLKPATSFFSSLRSLFSPTKSPSPTSRTFPSPRLLPPCTPVDPYDLCPPPKLKLLSSRPCDTSPPDAPSSRLPPSPARATRS